MKVTLGTLKEKGDELAAFLEPRIGAKPTLEGGAIEVEDDTMKAGVKPRHVKTYIKRFLYMKGVRKNYRVFVSGKELTIQEIVIGEKEEEEKEEKKAEPEKAEETKAEEPEKEAPEETPAPEETGAEAEEKPEKAKKAPAKKPRTKKKKAEASEG